MSTQITVYHPMETCPGNGERTVFDGGGDLDYRIEEGGHLRIMNWMASGRKGDALFAAGAWTYVCRSIGVAG